MVERRNGIAEVRGSNPLGSIVLMAVIEGLGKFFGILPIRSDWRSPANRRKKRTKMEHHFALAWKKPVKAVWS